MAKRTQETNSSKAATTELKGALGLDDLIQQGARQIIQQAIEAELAALLEQYSNVKTLDGRRAIVRNGYLPEREVVTAVGPVPVQVPKVRDRSGSGVKFNSNIVPPYVRKSPRVSAALTRAREDMKHLQRQAKQRLLSFLSRHGHRYTGRSRWTQAHWRRLERIKFARPEQQIVLQAYIDTVQACGRRVASRDREVETVAHASPVWPALPCQQTASPRGAPA
jgi:Transposase, Mutator family